MVCLIGARDGTCILHSTLTHDNSRPFLSLVFTKDACKACLFLIYKNANYLLLFSSWVPVQLYVNHESDSATTWALKTQWAAAHVSQEATGVNVTATGKVESHPFRTASSSPDVAVYVSRYWLPAQGMTTPRGRRHLAGSTSTWIWRGIKYGHVGTAVSRGMFVLWP